MNSGITIPDHWRDLDADELNALYRELVAREYIPYPKPRPWLIEKLAFIEREGHL